MGTLSKSRGLTRDLHVFNIHGDSVISTRELMQRLKEKDEEIDRLRRMLSAQAIKKSLEPETIQPTKH